MSAPRFFATAADFRYWLGSHAATGPELIVGFHKVGSGKPSMSWSESVDEALCVGWIDAVRRRIDAQTYQIRFTRRRPTSIWSAINIDKFHALMAEGRMQQAGIDAFALRSEAKSRVYAHERTEDAVLAPDELRAFQQDVAGWRYFETTPPGYRKVLLHWVTSAKRPATRAARLAKLLAACRMGERLRWGAPTVV